MLAVVGILALLAWRHTDLIADGFEALRGASPQAVALAIGAMALVMASQAEVMVVLLRAAGVPTRRSSANVLGLAANAFSNSLPGGPAISAAFIFREQMRWGATTVVAGWYLVVSGILAGIAMAFFGLAALLFVNVDGLHPVSLGLSLAGGAAVIAALMWAGRNTQAIGGILHRAVRAFNRLCRAPEDRFSEQVEAIARQLRAVAVSPWRLLLAFFWSAANWAFELACLTLCIYAVGGEPDLAGVALSFVIAKLVAKAQITPGGLGPVDIALTSALVPLASIPSGQAVAAIIVFRLINFGLTTLVGWLAFLWSWVVSRRLRHAPVAAAPGGSPARRADGP